MTRTTCRGGTVHIDRPRPWYIVRARSCPGSGRRTVMVAVAPLEYLPRSGVSVQFSAKALASGCSHSPHVCRPMTRPVPSPCSRRTRAGRFVPTVRTAGHEADSETTFVGKKLNDRRSTSSSTTCPRSRTVQEHRSEGENPRTRAKQGRPDRGVEDKFNCSSRCIVFRMTPHFHTVVQSPASALH